MRLSTRKLMLHERTGLLKSTSEEQKLTSKFLLGMRRKEEKRPMKGVSVIILFHEERRRKESDEVTRRRRYEKENEGKRYELHFSQIIFPSI